METVCLKPLYYRGQENIAIDAPDKGQLNIAIRQLLGVKWSQTHKVWYLPLNEAAYKQITAALKPLAVIDNNPLKQYLNKRSAVKATELPPVNVSQKHLAGKTAFLRKLPAQTAAWQREENLKALHRFIEELKLKGYSLSTIQTYKSEFLRLLQLLKQKPVHELTPDDLRRYMVYAMEKEGISAHTAHSRLNALKFYFEQVLKREKFFWEIPRPKKPQLLPKVLSEQELERMFAAVHNIKHKALLFTAYSAGLRVSEVVNLKIAAIDSGRRQIRIEKEGKKDRYVGLSILLPDVLRAYLQQIKPRSKVYLFEGQLLGAPYTRRSAQLVFH
ncbi:MAG: phage integrase N-terminal SAM-like domain-containing protein, partial [Bacteroidota bacterium]|nr:phage integrase N-terminal SAM-like domain-containing protein [Bacteroidota bacterium]